MVAEDRLAGKRGDQFADHAHGRQHHDVHGGVRVEPEEVLEEHWIAAQRGIEDADVEDALAEQQDDGDRQNRRAQHLDQRGGVIRPDEQRHARPGHSGGAHPVYGDDEVEAGENRREAGDEDAERGGDHPAIGIGGAVGSVEGPASVDAARQHGEQGEQSTDHQQIPAQQVDARKRQIARADHHRQKEIAERRGNRRNQEEEHHGHTVHGEQLVIRVRRHEVTRRREQFHADHGGESAAQEKEQGNGGQVEQADALVVFGEQPGFETVALIEVMFAFLYCRGNHNVLLLPPQLRKSERLSRGSRGRFLTRFVAQPLDVFHELHHVLFGDLPLIRGHQRTVAGHDLGLRLEDRLADVGFVGHTVLPSARCTVEP